MASRVNRSLKYDPRMALQQADQAIKKDIMLALVELITNADDSYRRLEHAGEELTGAIFIDIWRKKRAGTIIRITDHAEGMTDKDMDQKIGTYAGATSGFQSGKSVRGMFGRGLKDSIFGLGKGKITSVRNGIKNYCQLGIERGKPNYRAEVPFIVDPKAAEKSGWPLGNFTEIAIEITRDDIPVPIFDTLRKSLGSHYQLRDILQNPNRIITLREGKSRKTFKREDELIYFPPTGQLVLEEEICFSDFPATAKLTVFNSELPLVTPVDGKPYCDGGIIIKTGNVALDLTLFKYDNNEYAQRIYGELSCEYLETLLRKGEPIVDATRRGIDWKHEFTNCLKTEAERLLAPIIEAEKARQKQKVNQKLSTKVQTRLNELRKKLNEIVQLELGPTDEKGEGPGKKGDKLPVIPEGGFGFVPEYVQIVKGKTAGLVLRVAIPDVGEDGAIVSIESSGPGIRVITPDVVIEPREDYPHIGQATVHVEGLQVGSLETIVAILDDRKAEALVQVAAKIDSTPPEPKPKRGGGMIDAIKLDAEQSPKVRVFFSGVDSTIVISTKAPSVSMYIDEQGASLEESPAAQVLLAELVSEALCREIARKGFQSGKYVTLDSGSAEAIQVQQTALQNKYAHIIHQIVNQGRGSLVSVHNGGDKRKVSKEERIKAAVVEI